MIERGAEDWETWQGEGEPQYWYTAGPSTAAGSTYYAIDPSLDFDPSALANLPLTAPPTVETLGSGALCRPASPSRDDRRLFSTTTVIDHRSPPASPSINDEAGLGSVQYLPLYDDQLRVNPLGGTYAGVLTSELPVPPSAFQTAESSTSHAGETGLVHSGSRSAVPNRSPLNPGMPSIFRLPPPPASAPPASKYSVPPLPPPPHPGYPTDRPLQYAEYDASRPPARSKRRRAPSPLDSLRPRPSPYPTTSFPPGIPTYRESVLTPVSHALHIYKEYPVPDRPPPISEFPKKSHGRRTSVGHIPRPRNAFILFRSHAVSSGLIPRSVGIRDHSNISKIVGSVWRGLSDEERARWEELAEEEKRMHKERYPDYVYKPKKRVTAAKPKEKAALDEADEDEIAAASGSSNAIEGDIPVNDEEFVPTQPKRKRGNSVRSTRPTPKKPATAADLERQHRKMELIGQAVLEGEDEEKIMARVEQELAQQDKAASAASPSKGTRRSSPVKAPSQPASTPRKTRSTIHQRLKAGSSSPDPSLQRFASPASSSSSFSPTPTRQRQYSSGRGQATSPASSASPSPQRMQQPPRRSAASPPSASRHPLFRSHGASGQSVDYGLPASRRNKTSSYAAAGLGVGPSSMAMALPPTPASTAGPSPQPDARHGAPSPSCAFPDADLDAPLFTGAVDSRQFSLGKWELRKPSAAIPSRREQLAQLQEEQLAPMSMASTSGWLDEKAEAAGQAAGRISSVLALDPKEFLVESGLEDDDAFDALTEYGTAASSASYPVGSWARSGASDYETAPSTAPPTSHRMSDQDLFKQPLFRQPSSSTQASGSFGEHGGGGFDDLFHFGEVDLFSQPPPALFPASDVSGGQYIFGGVGRTISSTFGFDGGLNISLGGDGEGTIRKL
ncbi:specific transcriptional repressor [Rhodotorula toruloides]|uniref:Specific transcriptional repressor n=1 Tax=Rhodotorula toruloides TaxID=5286 RepID=A0A511K9B1_RHOTO|nr:specific transcriptional repressor [Rhodotorula toruloides]